MAEFIAVEKASELKDGALREVSVRGSKILLARIGENFYAAESHCPHLGASLARGILHGSVITCPRHGSQFDLIDGHVVRWTQWSGLISRLNKALRSPKSLKVYRTKVEDGKILVEL